MSNSNKSLSPLVEAVTALDSHFHELSRLGAKIEEAELRTDFDFEQMQKLLNRFAEYGQSISTEVVTLSQSLNEARAQAETTAKKVSEKALEYQALHQERQSKMNQFRELGEKVNALNASLQGLDKHNQDEVKSRLTNFDEQIRPLIDEAENLKNEAQTIRMKTLEQGADSLRQSLIAVNEKLKTYQSGLDQNQVH